MLYFRRPHISDDWYITRRGVEGTLSVDVRCAQRLRLPMLFSRLGNTPNQFQGWTIMRNSLTAAQKIGQYQQVLTMAVRCDGSIYWAYRAEHGPPKMRG